MRPWALGRTAHALQLGRAFPLLLTLVRTGFDGDRGAARRAATAIAVAILHGARDRSREPHLRTLHDVSYRESYRLTARRGTPTATGSRHVGFRCALNDRGAGIYYFSRVTFPMVSVLSSVNHMFLSGPSMMRCITVPCEGALKDVKSFEVSSDGAAFSTFLSILMT